MERKKNGKCGEECKMNGKNIERKENNLLGRWLGRE
jgi:hypothetical protein